VNNKELQNDLFEAIDAGNLRRIEVLINMGVDVGVERLISPVSTTYITPLQHAINKRNTDIVILLYEASGKNGIISEDDRMRVNQYLNPPQVFIPSDQVVIDIKVKNEEAEEQKPIEQEQEKLIKKSNKGAKK